MDLDKKGMAKVIDIETSSLLSDMLDYSSFPYKLKSDAKLWCVVIRDVYTDEIFTAEKEQITKEWMRENLQGVKYLVQHNGIKFDLITLKLFGVLDYTVGYLDEPDTIFGETTTIIDTVILSRLLHPDRFGGHSLAEWGKRTGHDKIDFRQLCINKGYIQKGAEKGAEFKQYCPEMLLYCIGDTEVNKNTFFALMQEMDGYKGWNQAMKMENKLADLAVRRESLGFWFDKDLAVKCVEDLTVKMDDLRNKVNPILPPKPMGKTEINSFIPPATQFLKNGKPSTHIVKFAQRIGATIEECEDLSSYFLVYDGNRFELPHNAPVKTHTEADISNLDHVKMTLINDYDWEPSEWTERDFTKDSKKQLLPYEKRIVAVERWAKETEEGKYKRHRLEIAFESYKVKSVEKLLDVLGDKLKQDFPVRLPTSPKVRVGVEKELCPNLVSLGQKVEFANDFALYLTYKHRKSSIAGGEIEDMDFDVEYPNSGFLSMYREVDGRIPTPAIEIGAVSHRYRHIGVANIARSSSIYGKEMRSLFGCGEGYLQLGFDYNSLENRVQGGYVKKYPFGEELAETLMAEKPNDLHSLNATKLGLSRTDAKSVGYMLVYGGKPPKVKKMLKVDEKRSNEIYNDFWNAVPALRDLKKNVEKFWEENGKQYIPAIDGRKINIRSQHSLLNFLFQSCGVICAKYSTVFICQELEKQGYCIDPFQGRPDMSEMISYHDESQYLIDPQLVTFKMFDSKEEVELFESNWTGENQLSTVAEGNKWYVTLPNPLSVAIERATKKVEQTLKLDFALGFDWVVHKNWYGCH